MKRFFNLIPGESECCILLYGEIGSHDFTRCGDISRELMEAEATYKKIDIRINSLGGDVYTGIAIFNAVRNSKADITLYVDGVAASMASVIALCGKPIHMSKYARLMIHGISGGCYGNKEDLKSCLKDIEALETTLCEMYAQKLQLSPDEIRKRYFDGSDHWLTANEAFTLGFINRIYDADPVAIPEESTPEQIYGIFQNSLTKSDNKPINTSMVNKFKHRPRFANCKNETDIIKCVDKLERELGTYQRKELEQEEKELNAILDGAINDGRIGINQKSAYMAMLRADRKSGEAAINALKPKRRVMDFLAQHPQTSNSKDKSQWTLTDYRKYAPKELQRDAKLYKSLLEKEQESKNNS